MTAMREAFAAAATALLDEDEDVAVVLADISVRHLAPAAARHPARVVNVGIREQLLVGVSAGLALEGLTPIAHTYAPFLVERAFEQIKLDLGHQDVRAVLVSIGASYDASREGRTHQAPGDVALLDTLPGWTVAIPGHADEVDSVLRRAVAAPGRTYVRLSEQQNARPRRDPAGGFEVVREGRQGTVVAVGPMLDVALEAARHLDVTILAATTVRPFDTATLLATLSVPAVALVEPVLAGTSLPAVSAALAHVPSRLLGLGVQRDELRRYGTPQEHQAAHGLDAAGLRASLEAFFLD